jgi:polyferredoxin
MPGEPSRLLPHGLRGARLRADRLAHRVRWLDRYRRVIAIVAAAVLAPILVTELGDQIGADWPQNYAALLLSLLLGVILWWTIEVGLVYVTALWETERYRLTSDRGLPRAILHKSRR